MPQDFFSWLHLTDFHYGLKGQDCLWPTLREPFLESLAPLHDRCGPWHAVLFTGDLTQSGESAQFEEMQAEVLERLWEKMRELGSGDAVLLAVPGNHDLYRPNPLDDDPAAERLLEQGGFERIEAKFWDNSGGSYRRVVNNAFAAYSQWWNSAPYRPHGITSGILPGDFSATIEIDDRRIGVVGLNTTFLQLGEGNYEGRLAWNARQLHAVCEGGVDAWSKRHDAALLLTHQGPNWLTPAAARHGESEIAPAGRFAIHMYGHQHEAEITYLSRGGARNAVRRCQGCSVFGMDKFGEPPRIERVHGYSAGRIDFGAGAGAALRLWPRIATNKLGPWRFIPDHEHAVLLDDDGTELEPVATLIKSGTSTQVSVGDTVAEQQLRGMAPLAGAVPHSTLPSRRPFFGRTADLERMAKYLHPDDRSWGVVVDGPGGVGKTALALEAAHLAPAEHFPLKLWITAKNRELLPHGEQRLTDHRVEDFYAMLNELAKALGRDDIPKAVPKDRPNLIRHTLSGYRALLVLDNLETFSVEDRQRSFELLGNLPSGCRAIVTSRRRTDGSTAAHTIRLDKLEREAADELLAELGGRWEPVAQLTAKERDRLYTETGGNPLLLTWTAGQLGRTTGRCRTVDAAVGRLQEVHRLKSMNSKNDPLDYVFGDLVDTFTADEVTILAALVHFTQPASISWLLPLVHMSEKAAETALDGLRDRALLIEDDRASTWLLPPLANRFLRRSRPEAVGTSGERLANHAYALAVENGYAKDSLYPILEAAWSQISAALPVLLTGTNARLQGFCDALKHFLDFSGRWDELIALSTAAEAAAVRAQDYQNAGWRAYDSGWCHYQRGQAVEVLACANRASAHWEAIQADPFERATVWRLQAMSHMLTGDNAAAAMLFRQSVELVRSIRPSSHDLSTALQDLARALKRCRLYDEAEVFLREALDMTKTLTYEEGISTCTSSLADLALKRDQWPDAEKLGLEALELAEKINRRGLVASCCRIVSDALLRQGRGAEGRAYAERAVAINSELRSSQLSESQTTLAACLAAS